MTPAPPTGSIEKMRIEIHKKSDCTDDAINTIFVQFNPEKYNSKQTVTFCEGQAMGSTGADLKFNRIDGEEVNFEFLFDGSGIVPPAQFIDGSKRDLASELADMLAIPDAVGIEVELFRSYLMGYQSDTHQTAYLKLIWGGYNLNCRLKSMDIEYLNFRRDGRPLRARVKCTFKGTVDYLFMVSLQKKESPDVTHERMIKQSDKITLLAEEIYKKNHYYIDVAKANQLLSFRKIDTGQKLFFPPLK